MGQIELTPRQNLLSERLKNADTYIKQTIAKNTASGGFRRDAYYQSIEQYLASFQTDPKNQNYWVIMGGLRGVGKTTLLCQLYLEWSQKIKNPAKIFFLSLDEAYSLSADFTDIEKVIENELDDKLYSYKNPIYIFLDEVHFIDKWSVNAKIWHDRCQQLFLLCTGSSAISFWTNADIARRAKIINIRPLSFVEFVSLKIVNQPHYRQLSHQKNKQALNDDIKELNLLADQISAKLKQCLIQTNGPEATFVELQKQTDKLTNYLKKVAGLNCSGGIDLDLMIDQYINRYMSLPYAIVEIEHTKPSSETTESYQETGVNEEAIRASITQTLENVFNKDLNVLHSFNQATRAIFPDLLLSLANNDATQLSTLSKKLKINIQTLQSMLKVLIDGQVISAVPPLGASTGKISKPYKYLFNSPAIRQALSPILLEKAGSKSYPNSQLRGKLLEDAVYLSLKKVFTNTFTDPQVEYDASKGGADFIIMPRSGVKQEAVVIEVGYNKTSHQQVQKTLKRAGGWGLVITNIKQPKKIPNEPVVYIPLKLFLMM